MPCIVNAANEVVNRAFIDDRIPFTRIADIISQTMQHISFSNDSQLETYLETDREARLYASSLL